MVVCGQQYKAKIENLLRKKAALKRIRQYAGVVSWFIARADKVREDVTPLRRVSHVVFIRNQQSFRFKVSDVP